MKQQDNKRIKWLTIRLSEAEYAQVEELAKGTLSPSLSDYARRMLLQKPISIRYRNQSLDDFLADMLPLRHDLKQLGNNVNQAVHRLHTLRNVPEISQWLLLNEQDKTRIFRLLETINNKITESYKVWSRE